jgi:D-glycero-beta-D-manno-heptose-7-phosphate kinase
MDISANQIFESFKGQKVLVVGDVMIDSYIWGKGERISPEAPVPIVNVSKKEYRLGGAANVALNLQALGAVPVLCAVVGDDNEADAFYKLLTENNLSSEGLLSCSGRLTTIKHRIISHSQHILRVDQEHDHLISAIEQQLLFSKIANILQNQKVDVLVFEDYDKGVLSETLIQKIVKLCESKSIPTVVDPKKRNFLHYKNVTLFKPNLKELREGLKIEVIPSQIESVNQATAILSKELNAKAAFVTLSEFGVYISDSQNSYHVMAHKREIADVSGAGDTVVSVAALCVGAGFGLKLTAELSNLAGGIVCEKVGVVPISVTELVAEAVKAEILNG